MQLPAARDDPGVRYVAGSLVAGIFLPGVAVGIAYPTLPQLEPVLGLAPAVVGVIISTTGAVRLLCNAPVGMLLDRVGTRRPLLAGFAALGVAPFGYASGVAPDPLPVAPTAVFLASRAVAGVGTALVVVGAYATITDVTTPDNRGRWLGYLLGAYGLGFPVGMLAGGVAADRYGLRAAFLLAGCLGVLSVLIVFVLVPDRTATIDPGHGLRRLPGLLRRDHRLVAVGATQGVLRFLSAAFLTTVVLFAAELGLSLGGLGDVGVSGVVLALSSVAAAAANVGAGRASDALEHRLLVLVPSLLVLAGGFAVVAAVPTLPGVLAGATAAGVGGGAASPVLYAFLGDISPAPDVGKLGGAFNVFGDVGAILGPVLAIPAATSVGFDALYAVCAVLGIASLVLLVPTVRSAGAPSKPSTAE